MSTFYDLPRSSVAVFKADDPSDAFRILLTALKTNEKCGFICHEAFATWHREIHVTDSETVVFSEFAENSEVNPDDITASDVIFADFDLYSVIFGIPKALNLIKSMKTKKRIFIVTSSDLPPTLHLEQLTNATFAIKKTENPAVFECSTTLFDKKGNFTISDQLITTSSVATGAKPTFKTNKKSDNIIDDSFSMSSTTQSDTGKSAMNLPFFVGRQEDGVAIRDAATKKIRVGGQIVYEPDRDDDLDDSDPDDDLNI